MAGTQLSWKKGSHTKKRGASPHRVQCGLCTVLCKAGQASGCFVTAWCHPALGCDRGWSHSGYSGYCSVQAALCSRMGLSQHSSTLSVGTGSILAQTRFTKCNVNGIEMRQLAEPRQARRSTTTRRQIYQMFQAHRGATRLSYCENCVLPPVVLASCKNTGKWWLFESYFPFLKLVLP